MSKPYIERKYVELREETYESVYDPERGCFIEDRKWHATVDGMVTPTGERVYMWRVSNSAGEALLLLTEALAEQGYELR